MSVRFLEEDKPSTKFYRLIKLEDNATGEELFNILKKNVLMNENRKKKLISLITDGASGMCGKEQGVATRVAEIVPDLFGYSVFVTVYTWLLVQFVQILWEYN